ncbi:MAG: alpha/beta fold hydrolase, partial [Ilumatobacter sp.]|uniref:alpha/beta fold hydrolase n=1 Tax=Ilumatobacter sp. TaxID=1967498 RepID=UPI003C71937B
MRRSVVTLAVGTLIMAACTGSGSDGASSTSADTSSPDTIPDEAGADPDEAEANPDTGTIDWELCAEQPAPGANKECATLPVPLDHEEPDGETIDLAVSRFATSGADRIGSLVFNPGGPGGSGIDFLDQAIAIMPIEVTERFDLVGFDPRGVGASAPLECDIQIDDNIPLLEAGDDAGWQKLLDESAEIPTDCTEATLELARYVGTNNAARDLDLLREALGDEGLTYVGYSYGTRLGATYAELFPDRVRALVLDAAVKPTDDSHELSLGQAQGFDRALENFAAACDADSDCILQDVGPTLEVLDGLRSEIADVGEFPTDDPDRVLTPGELELGVIASLYSKESWPFLAQALFLAEAEQDGTLLQILGDQLVGRSVDGTYDNSQIANSFINCADDPTRPDADSVRRLADEAAALSTRFDEALRATTGCLGIEPALDPLIV